MAATKSSGSVTGRIRAGLVRTKATSGGRLGVWQGGSRVHSMQKLRLAHGWVYPEVLMADRKVHYEAAFEAMLRAKGIPCGAVDEAKRAVFANAKLKSFDFV